MKDSRDEIIEILRQQIDVLKEGILWRDTELAKIEALLTPHKPL